MGLFSRFMLRVGVANRLGLFAVLSVLILFASLFLARSYELRALGGAEALCQEQDERGMIVETSASYQTEAMAEWRVFLAATNIYTSEIGKLRYAENDVDELVKIFRALGVKEENLIVLKSSNEDPYKTTSQRSIELNYKRFISGLTENSIAFVFLSGHGFTDANGTGSYYAPKDFIYDYFDETKISINDMMTQLSESKARFKWLCVDACRNDLAPSVKKRSNSKAKNLAISQVPEGVILTQSCRQGQFSYEYGGSDAPFNNGLFTRAFVDAISGRSPEADANRDGVVTLGEIRDYLESRVPKDAQRYCNGMQNPTFTMMKGASFSDIADYKLFEDMPIFGHHPKDWWRGQTLRQEAEALEKEEKYGEALEKIKEAYSILPDVPEVEKLKNRIEELFRAHDNGAKAKDAYKNAEEALNAKKFQEALQYIDQAIQLDPNNSTYPIYRKLIESQQKLAGEPPKPQVVGPPKPQVDEADSARSESPTSGGVSETNPAPETGSLKAGAVRELTISGVKVRFRWCPPGEFMMGSPSSEAGRDDDEAQHKVRISRGFWLAETETTQELWHAVMGDNPSYFKGNDLPVEQVSWDDCQEFIKKLNSNARSGLHFQLPSEAHWEYACRAGTRGAYNVSVASLDNSGWYSDNSNGATHKVGTKTSNAWGLYDMHGNVWEWCSDWYGGYPSGDATNPTGPKSGSGRVVRGGGWDNRSGNCRSALRRRFSPGNRDIYLGFRLELTDASK